MKLGRETKGSLLACPDHGFDRFHHRALRLGKAIASDLSRVFLQLFDVDRRRVAFAAVVAVEPDGEVIRIGDLQEEVARR